MKNKSASANVKVERQTTPAPAAVSVAAPASAVMAEGPTAIEEIAEPESAKMPQPARPDLRSLPVENAAVTGSIEFLSNLNQTTHRR